MMDYAQWKAETKRGLFTPRSSKLVTLDKAFARYSKSKTTPNLIALAKALRAWIDSKANWKQSTRNSKMIRGKGTVERLVDQLYRKPMLKQTFASLTVPRPPPPVVLEQGRKIHQKDADGRHYNLTLQNRENSCGPACIRIVVKLVQNVDVGEDSLRQYVEMAEEGADYHGGLGQGGVIASTSTAHDWGPTGGGTWYVPEALASVRPMIRAIHVQSTAALRSSTRSKPIIGVVEWDPGGGLHYVVVAGPLRTVPNSFLVIDPFYGVQRVPVAHGSFGWYEPVDPNGGANLARAKWYPWTCRVT